MDLSFNAVRTKAAEVFGSFESAEDWICSPVRGLDYRTPGDLLKTEGGREQVLDMLERIDQCSFW